MVSAKHIVSYYLIGFLYQSQIKSAIRSGSILKVMYRCGGSSLRPRLHEHGLVSRMVVVTPSQLILPHQARRNEIHIGGGAETRNERGEENGGPGACPRENFS